MKKIEYDPRMPGTALRTLSLLVPIVLCLGASHLRAAEPVSFVREIAPILRDKCLTCHGPEKAKGEYRLDTFELLQKPGASKATPITAGAPAQSHLFELVTATDEDDRMPQKDEALPKPQIALIERWIKEGARYDATDPKLSLAALAGFVEQPSPPNVYRAPVPVTAMAFHSDGTDLAVGGYHEITVWNVNDGVLLRRITNVAERTLGLAYNRDGTLLASASGTPGKLGETKLFDAKTGKLLRTLAVIPDLMLTVAFDSQQSRIACAGADNTIRILDVESGQARLTIEQHADWVDKRCVQRRWVQHRLKQPRQNRACVRREQRRTRSDLHRAFRGGVLRHVQRRWQACLQRRSRQKTARVGNARGEENFGDRSRCRNSEVTRLRTRSVHRRGQNRISILSRAETRASEDVYRA